MPTLNDLNRMIEEEEKKNLNATQRITTGQKNPAPQNAYQQNLQQTASQRIPSTRELMGAILETQNSDPEAAANMFGMLKQRQQDPTSAYYNPYTQPTNKAVGNLANMGVDVSRIDDDWYNRNGWLMQHYNQSGTTNNPTSPGKKATLEQNAAYQYYQVYQAEENTRKAEQEWKALQQELNYWAQQTDRNYSDEEIISRIDWSKYKTLQKMDDTAKMGAPMELNRAVGYSRDAMYGTIWAARNGGGSGDLITDMAMSALGEGNTWKANADIAARRSVTDKDGNRNDSFNPFWVGSTLDDARVYFNASSFDQNWIDTEYYKIMGGSDETAKKYASQVYDAFQFTQKAKEEKAKLDADMARYLASDGHNDPEKAAAWLDKKLASGNFPTLAAMDKSIAKGDVNKMVGTTEAIQYGKHDYTQMIREGAAKNAEKGDIYDQNDLLTQNGAGAAVTGLTGETEHPAATAPATSPATQAATPATQTVPPSAETAPTSAPEQTLTSAPTEVPAAAPEQPQTTEGAPASTTAPVPATTPAPQEPAAPVSATPEPQQPAAPANLPMTKEEKESARATDKKVREDFEAVEGIATPAEQAVMSNTPSMFSYSMMKKVLAFGHSEKRKMNDYMMNTAVSKSIGSYATAELETVDLIAGYERNIALSERSNAEIRDLEAKLGNKVYVGVDPFAAVTRTVEINGFPVQMTFYTDGETYYTTGGQNETPEMINSPGYRDKLKAAQEEIIADLNERQPAILEASGQELTEEEQAMLDRYHELARNTVQLDTWLADNESAYQAAQDKMQRERENRTRVIGLLEKGGASPELINALENSAVVTDYLHQFGKLDPIQYAPYNLFNILANDTRFGGNVDGAKRQAAEYNENNEQLLETSEWVLEYADRYGIQIPAETRERINDEIAQLKSNQLDYGYFTERFNADFKSGAKEGREIVEGVSGRDLMRDWTGYFNGAGGLEDLPMWRYLSPDRQEQIRGAINSGDTSFAMNVYEAGAHDMILEDRLFGLVKIGNLLTREELDTYYYKIRTQGYAAAEAYYNHLAAPHGVLEQRNAIVTSEGAKEIANSGDLGGVVAELAAAGLSAVDALASVAYGGKLLFNRLNGRDAEYSSTDPLRSAAIFRKAARGEVHDMILRNYGEKDAKGNYQETTKSKVLTFFLDMVESRADSAVNAMFFGPIFGNIDNPILQEFLGSVPMATSAAYSTMDELSDKGVSEDKMLAMGFVTFLGESVTEALTYGNIKETFHAGTELTATSFRDFMRNWLTRNGIEEMFGESVSDILGNIGDREILGVLGDHQARVNAYLEVHPGAYEDAEAAARKDEISALFTTALSAYLSPGLDAFAFGAGRYSELRAETRGLQQSGYNVSIFDVMRADKMERKMADENTRRQAVEGLRPRMRTSDSQSPAAQVSPTSGQEAGTAVPTNTAQASQEAAQAPQDAIPAASAAPAEQSSTVEQSGENAPSEAENAPSEAENEAPAAPAEGAPASAEQAAADGETAPGEAAPGETAPGETAPTEQQPTLPSREDVRGTASRFAPPAVEEAPSTGKNYSQESFLIDEATTAAYQSGSMEQASAAFVSVFGGTSERNQQLAAAAIAAGGRTGMGIANQVLENASFNGLITPENERDIKNGIIVAMLGGHTSKCRKLLYNHNTILGLDNPALIGQLIEAVNQDRQDPDVRKALNRNASEALGGVDLDAIQGTSLGDFFFSDENVAQRDAEARQASANNDTLNSMWMSINYFKGTDQNSQTAGLAAALTLDESDESVDMAIAAAANMDGVFPSGDAKKEISELIAGASAANVDASQLKQALINAALGKENSAAWQLINKSERYAAATPEQKAAMLTNVTENSFLDGVKEQAIREHRIAEAEKPLIAAGALDGAVAAQEVADKANRSVQQAQTDLDTRQDEVQANAEAVQAAVEAQQQDAGNPDRANDVTQAVTKLDNSTKVQQEYEQRLANSEEAARTAQAKANKEAEVAMADVRKQAAASVDQADQQRAEQKAAEEEIARVQAEEEAQRQAEEDEQSGKAWEDKRDALIENLLDSDHLEGEARETKRQELQQRAEQIRLGKIDMTGLMNNTEGFLAVSAFGRKLNLQFQLSDNLPSTARGEYRNGVVYLNRNLIREGNMTVGQALVEASLHEITHSMENTKSYQSYRKTVLECLFGGENARDTLELKNDQGKTIGNVTIDSAAYNAAIDQKKADYRRSVGQELSDEKAQQEIIADFARTHLNGRDVVQRFMDAGLGGKMRNALHNINQALKNFRLKGEEKTTAEYLRRAERAFQKAMNEVAAKETHPEGGQFSVIQFAQAAGMTVNENTLQLYDANGKEIDGIKNKVTPDMIRSTPVGMLIDLAETGMKNKKGVQTLAPTINAETAQAQRQMFSDLMNMVAQYKDSNLVWEIASSTLFSAMKENSDPQYSTTVDFGTICAKTQEIINVMSQVMLKEGRGLTRDEVLKVYNETAQAGLTVPCPVCYVFSRWMGVPSLLGQMSRYQKDLVKLNEDGSINTAETQKAADEYIRQALAKYGSKKRIDKAKTSINNRLKTQEKNRTKALSILSSETATEAEKAAAKEKHDFAIKRMDELTKELGEVEAYNWVTQALCKETEKDSGVYVVDPDFQITPDDVLFDLRKTGEFAKYTKNWTYRNTRGAGMGKAIMPYSGESIGDIVYGTSRKAELQNPFLTQDPQTAADGVKNAIRRARQQNLIGGQRLQSTSDFRPEWGLDYMMSFLELQAIGSKVQMYTKVAEAVPLLASMGGDINLSIMGKGSGFHEASAEDVAAMTEEERQMATVNGKVYVMDFSDVTGMKYETARGLKDQYDDVQMILVGMNDIHIRLAMASKDIDFIIPWHSSGNSKDVLGSMISSVGESLETSSDYTDAQTDKAKKGRTAKQKQLWDARMALLTKGGDALTLEERQALLSNPFTADLYKRFTQEGIDPDCYGVKLRKEQAEQIFPYEYWDKSLTKDQADQNGNRFVEYCEAMGITPRFSQFKNDKGYWKLLIDRPMYDNKGNYRDQQVVDVTKAKVGRVENGQLVDSDIPLQTSAMYGPDYSEQEKTAVDNTLAAIGEQSDMRETGQFSALGEMTDADMEQMLSQTASDYRSAIERGDMEAAAKDVETYAANHGYTLEIFHGTGEYFNEFRRGFEGIHLGNEFQASQVAEMRYSRRSKNTSYSWGDIKNRIYEMNNEQREALVKDAYLKQDYFDDGQSVPEFEGDLNSWRDVARYVRDIVNRYAKVSGDNPDHIRLTTLTFDRKTGEHVMRLYAKINNPFLINGDIGQWDPASIAGVILRRSEGKNTIIGYDYKDVDITGSDFELTDDQRNNLERLNNMEIQDNEEKWDVLSDVLNEMGFDGIKYLNTYEGDRNSYSYIALKQSDVKSADTVTYDDEGNMIPLSKRFTDQSDIRYSSGGEMTEADLEQKMSDSGLDTSPENRVSRQIDQYDQTLAAMSSWDDGSKKSISEIRDLYGTVMPYSLDQWMHNIFQKGRKKNQGISRADIEAFIEVDKERISNGAKSLHNGWISLFEKYSNADIGHDLDSVNNARPRYYTDGISRSRSIANAVFSSKLNIYNGSDSKENRGDFLNLDTNTIIRVDNKTINETLSRTDKKNKNRNAVIRILMNTDTLLRDAVYIGSHIDYEHADTNNSVHYYAAQATAGGENNAVLFAVHEPTVSDVDYNQRAYIMEISIIPENNDGAPVDDTGAESAAGIDLLRQAPSGNSIGNLLGAVNTDRLRFFDKDSLSGKKLTAGIDGGVLSTGGETTDADLDQTLIENGILTQEEVDAYNRITGGTTPPGENLPGTPGMRPQRQFGSKTAQGSDALHDEVKEYLYSHSSYTPETNQEQIDRSIDWVRSKANESDPDGYHRAVDEVTSEAFDYRSADGQARMLTVMGMAAMKGDIETEMRLADAYNRQGTDLGRALQSRKIFRLMTPIGRIGYFQKQVDSLNDEIGQKTGKKGQIKLDSWTVRAIGAAESEEDFTKVRTAVAKQLADQLPINWKDRFQGWRMLSMLGNPRTHIRNIIGNAMFIPAVSIKNKLGAAAELGMKKGDRTKTLAPAVSKEIRDFARQDAVTMKDALTGEAKYNETGLVDQNKRQFKGVLQLLADFNSNALEAEDWFFLKGHYRRALGGWIQANGYTVAQLQGNPDLLEQGRAYAIQEAQKATYRDFNGVAKKLNDLVRNPETTGQKILAFGVEAVLPFKKTPANILKRGIEYSPIGVARSIVDMATGLRQYNRYQRGELDVLPENAKSPNQVIDELCAGLTGTGIMALGALLAGMGAVSCGFNDDDDEFEKLKGGQEYAIKLSLFGQDVTFTMDWAAPMSMPFFVGAAIQNQTQQEGNFDIDGLVNAFGNITEPVFNLSMLDGVNSLLDMFVAGDDTNATITQLGAKIFSNYATSYVPSILGAVARTVDTTRRKSFVESGKGTGILGTFRYAREQVENKIPGLSQTNIPYRDVWGNAEKSGLAERILENFVLPGYISQYKEDPVVAELAALGKVPKEPVKTISSDGEKFVLTDKQWDAYKVERGQTAYNLLGELMDTEAYQAADADERATLVDSVWDYATQKGKLAAIPEAKVDDWVQSTADPVGDIIATNEAKKQKKRVSVNKERMISSLADGDFEGYEMMVEALREDGVSDESIKERISKAYCDQYKEAYRNEDYVRMGEIEDLLDGTGFSFNVGSWEKAVDKENE